MKSFIANKAALVSFLVLFLDLASPSEGTAAADKLPYNRHFPRAAYPYAQAPDGCSGYDAAEPDLVRDNWGIADFTDVCNEHDRCYYTPGSNMDQCNDRFRDGLQYSCEDAVHEKPWLLPTLDACFALATSYYGVVSGARFGTFRDAQDLERRYMAYADEVLDGIFRKLTGRAISDNDLTRAHDVLNQTNLADVEADIIDRYAAEIVSESYRQVVGENIPRGDVDAMVNRLQAFGFDRLRDEIIMTYANKIVENLYFEIKGTRQIPPIKMLLYRNRLIQTRDPDSVRTLVRST